jgi:hypothetical protein
MGSGPRVNFRYIKEVFGLGFSVNRFPFNITVHFHVFFWCLDLGFGKAYDE